VLTDNLELTLQCDRNNRTTIAHQYTTYPLRLSPIFRWDKDSENRAYLYIMNISPGLLAGDRIKMNLNLGANTGLYLTEQAATKVHAMPKPETIASIDFQITIGEAATLELIPEPIIFYQDAALTQKTKIAMHPTATLFLSEILLPGRLARGESYQFRQYTNRLQVTSLEGELWFEDAMHLEGKLNPFKNSQLFASMPIQASFYLILPEVNLDKIRSNLLDLEVDRNNIIVASTILPQNKGLLVRVLANKTFYIKQYLKSTLNCVRQQLDRAPLPYIAK
jgi:urease accessory protein